MAAPIRVLTAVPICDGHDSAINTINLEFIRHGIEVIYLGYHRSVADIVRAAIQEDVRAIGISSYNGGHIEFFAAVVDLLRKKGADDIKVFGGGGGTFAWLGDLTVHVDPNNPVPNGTNSVAYPLAPFDPAETTANANPDFGRAFSAFSQEGVDSRRTVRLRLRITF